MAKLTDEQFSAYLAGAKEKLSAELPIAAEKKINYGYQYTVKLAEAKLTLNIYNGKKGLNIVYSGDSALAERAAALLEGRRAQAAAPATFVTDSLWAGSDESGKGDFFGSLVVAAVVVDNSTADKLRAAGVKDCKLLTDKKILELEDIIKASVVDYSVLELKPRVYNLRYEQVAAQGGKLNQLLGYGHVAALSKVLEKHEDCHSALIDQFTTSMVNIRSAFRNATCASSRRPRAIWLWRRPQCWQERSFCIQWLLWQRRPACRSCPRAAVRRRRCVRVSWQRNMARRHCVIT